MVGLSSKGPIVILYAHLALGEFGNKINKKVIRWFFLFNLELICICDFYKKLKLHSLKKFMQFQLTYAN